MDPNDAMEEYIKMLRDVQRPQIEEVAKVIDEHLMRASPGSRLISSDDGTWIWEDLSVPPFPKYFVLTGARGEGIEGYPLLTIRQAFSIKLDTWVTISALVPGSSSQNIARTLALLVAQHLCAFAAVKLSAHTVAAAGGNVLAAVELGKELMQLKTTEPLGFAFDPPASKTDDGSMN